MTDDAYEYDKNCRFDEQSLGGSFFMCRIYFQTAVRDLNMLSMEKRSGPIYVAGRETVTWHRTDSAVCTCLIRP